MSSPSPSPRSLLHSFHATCTLWEFLGWRRGPAGILNGDCDWKNKTKKQVKERTLNFWWFQLNYWGDFSSMVERMNEMKWNFCWDGRQAGIEEGKGKKNRKWKIIVVRVRGKVMNLRNCVSMVEFEYEVVFRIINLSNKWDVGLLVDFLFSTC